MDGRKLALRHCSLICVARSIRGRCRWQRRHSILSKSHPSKWSTISCRVPCILQPCVLFKHAARQLIRTANSVRTALVRNDVPFPLNVSSLLSRGHSKNRGMPELLWQHHLQTRWPQLSSKSIGTRLEHSWQRTFIGGSRRSTWRASRGDFGRPRIRTPSMVYWSERRFTGD